jgi:predicted ATPase
MIEKVWAKNYRSLKDMQLTFSPLTVLVGENGAGKSNLVDVLRFFSEALLFGLDVALFQRMEINQLYHWESEKVEKEIEIGISLRQPLFSAQYCLVLGKSNPQRRTGAYSVYAERGDSTRQTKPIPHSKRSMALKTIRNFVSHFTDQALFAIHGWTTTIQRGLRDSHWNEFLRHSS